MSKNKSASRVVSFLLTFIMIVSTFISNANVVLAVNNEETEYQVLLGAIDNGSYTFDESKLIASDEKGMLFEYAEDEEVIFSVSPDEGYDLVAVKVTDANSQEIGYKASDKGYSFRMPSGNVSVSFSLEEKEDEKTEEVSHEYEMEDSITDTDDLEAVVIDKNSDIQLEGFSSSEKKELEENLENGDVILVGAVNASSGSSRASSGTITLNKLQYLSYPISWGNYSTHYFTMIKDGITYPVYCIEPAKGSPVDGIYVYNVLNDPRMLSVLYYGYGGPGQSEMLDIYPFPGVSDLSSWEVKYVMTHVAASYVYYYIDGNNGDIWQEALKGINQFGHDNVMAFLDYAYDHVNDVPNTDISFSNNSLVATMNGSIQRTETTTFVASSKNTITVNLQNGVTLHNVSKGTTGTGSVTLNGGDQFYLSAPTSLMVTQSVNWSSGDLYGSITADWQALIMGTGSGTQVMGGGAYSIDPGNPTSFSVKWINYGKIKINKTSEDDIVAGLKFKVTGNGVNETVTTASDGTITIENLVPGNYKVEEVSSPDRYVDLEPKTVTVNPGETANVSFRNILKKFRVSATKTDAETGTVQGNATLAGAVYGIYKDGTLIDQYTTDDNGKFVTEYYICGTGWTIKEITPSKGYLLDSTEYQIGAEPKNFTVEKNTITEDVTEQIIRGDIEGVKIGAGTHKRLADVPFKITSKTTGESHIIVTDNNGQFSTAADWVSHKQNTNAGKSSEDGIWFGTSDPDDSHGALIYDTYEIEELRCDSNEGLKLIPAFDIVISRNNKVIDLGTLTDEYEYEEEEITIRSNATDKVTGGKTIVAGKNLTIEDTCTLDKLVVGTKYKLVGWQMIKEDNAELIIDSKRVENDYTFTATASKMDIKNDFVFDGTKLGGKNLVSYAELYDINNPDNPVLVADHKDINDVGQTIEITERIITIHTTATDKVTGGKTIVAGKDMTIVDTVTLYELEVGTKYKLTGWQMIKEENAELIIDGKRIENDYIFTATDSKMEVKIEFTFDGSHLGGKNLVSYEELENIDNPDNPIMVAEHKDINDVGQTIMIVEETGNGTIKTSMPGSGNSGAASSLKSVKTGDTTAIAIFVGALLVSGVVIIGAIKRKKNKKEDVSPI